MMRLDKFLKECGISSRSDAKKILSKGLITVNDKIIKSSDTKIDETKDIIKYNGKILKYEEFVYLMINKPQGVITATEDYKENTVLDLVTEYKHKNLFPFGRLDKDSVGLIILSNDGDLCHKLLSPSHHVDKVYYLKINGSLGQSEIDKFKYGITLDDGYKCNSAKLEIINSGDISECYVTINEGKFHQLKRMFERCKKEVIYLKRIKFGSVDLDPNLEEGKYRLLTNEEIDKLKGDYK